MGGPATLAPRSSRGDQARPLLLLYLTALAVLVADQLSKLWVVGFLGPEEGGFVPVIGDLLWLRMVHNRGAAFGVGQNASYLFAVAALVVALGIVYYSRRLTSAHWIVRAALGLELGGAIGNLVDRLRYGYVVDFIDVRLWPYVFNVSDAAITIGVVLLLVSLLLEPRDHPSPSPERQVGDRTA